MIIRKTFREELWKILIYAVITVGTITIQMLMYPNVKKAIPDMTKAFEQMDFGGFSEFVDMIAGAGFLGFVAGKCVMWIYITGIIYAVLVGMGSIAKEVENRTIMILLSNPVTRMRVMLDKMFVILIGLVFVIALSSAIIPPLSAGIGEEIEFFRVMIVGLLCGAVVLVILAYTLLFSCLLNDQIKVAVASLSVTTVMIILSSFKQTEKFGLFHYIDTRKIIAILMGTETYFLNSLVIALIGVAILIVSVYIFKRRDI